MGSDEKIPYPKSVFFIIGNEFCERFSYYGMRVVLSLYLAKYLGFSESDATVIFHAFIMLCYFTSLPGAILADSYLGKFKTILYLSILYALGNVILSLSSIEQLHLPPTAFSMIGLLFIGIGTGGIKPCVSAFGGDQFQLPQQAAQFASFFSIFYFSINAGSLISTTITPIFRKDVHCSSDGTCYPLAFGVPAALMIISLLIFVIGKKSYKIKPPEGNIILKVFSCIKHAIGQKAKSNLRRQHWLDHADDKFDPSLIQDIKTLLRVLVLYLPLPIFWTLYDQQGSTWTFQANRMDGWTPIYTIKPDQFQVINALLILGFIPLFDKIIYPKFNEWNLIKKPLQRLTVGGILAGVAFLVSALLELKLETTYPVLPGAGVGNLNLINTLPCPLNISISHSLENEKFIANIGPNSNFIFERINAGNYEGVADILQNENSFNCKSFRESLAEGDLRQKFNPVAPDGEANSALLVFRKDTNELKLIEPNSIKDKLDKAEGGCHLRVLYDGLDESWFNVSINLRGKNYPKYVTRINLMGNGTADERSSSPVYTIDEPLEYIVTLMYNINKTVKESNEIKLGEVELLGGGNYVLSVYKNVSNIDNGQKYPYGLGLSVITTPNSVHMLWLLPQYIIITVAEIMFSITGLEFSYSEAPQSMKSVVQSAWLLTVAFGNVITVILHSAHFFEKKSDNLFLFTGLMFLFMGIFAGMAYVYKPRNLEEEEKLKLKKREDSNNYNAINNNELYALRNNGRDKEGGGEPNEAFSGEEVTF